MKRIPPIIWGGLLITILFVAIVFLFNFFKSGKEPRPPSSVPPSDQSELPPVASSISPSATSSQTPTDAPSPWRDKKTVFYFPALPVNIYQYSLIQIKNTDSQNADDIKVTLLNRAGESQNYSVNHLEPNSINRFSLKNLAEVPLNFSPGLVIVSSDHSLAALAEIFPTGSEEKMSEESLAPISQPTRNLNFTVFSSAENEPRQNRLIITNPIDKLIEAQVSLTAPKQESQIIFTAELPPWSSQIINLPIPKFESLEQTAQINVSSTNYIIGAIYRLDKEGGLLSNISEK